MHKVLFKGAAVFLLLVLAACGGGGGASSNAPSNTTTPTPTNIAQSSSDFSLSANNLAMSATAGSGTAMANLVVTIKNSQGAYLVAGVPAGQITPSWLSLAISGNTVVVTASAKNLSVSSNTTTIRIVLLDISGNPLSYQDVPLTFNAQAVMTPTPTASGSPTPSPTAVASVSWNAYSADLVPDTDGALRLADGSTTPFTKKESSGTVTSTVAAGELTFDTSANAANTGAEQADYRYALPYSQTYPKQMTFVARVKAASVTSALRGLQFDVNMSDTDTSDKTVGSRVKLSIYGTSPSGSWAGFTIEACDNTSSTPSICRYSMSGIDSYHVYQVSFTLTDAKHGYVNVYIDGAATPAISYGSEAYPVVFHDAAGTGANYLRFGDNDAGYKAKAYLDWLVWTQSGAYTPAQIKGKLPANLGTVPAAYQ